MKRWLRLVAPGSFPSGIQIPQPPFSRVGTECEHNELEHNELVAPLQEGHI